MAFIESVNSKANVKQFTNNDLPFSPAQPVLNSFYAVSTAGQTSIANLGFSIDTVNNPDAFFLFVDGKKLRLGSTNDYVFAAVAADGTSSQITFNQALPINLNIQAYKLGLKPEVQFTMDNRFTQLYEAESAGFQAFVNTTSFLLTATLTTGTPAAGTFYSSITNRAALVDLSQDLKPRMAVDRIMTQTLSAVQGEVGPSGEPVWSLVNDTFGQVRFVGQWSNNSSSEGPHTVGNPNDYVEITFYGTGLNILMANGNSARTAVSSIDGGADSANFVPSSLAPVLDARGYNVNQRVQLYSGQTLGIHTVRIKSTATNLRLQGFEILNESSSVKVQPGISYFKGQKIITAAQASFAYNSVVTGTRGGRVLVYQNADGSIGQAWTPVNAASATLTSADHTNEEVVRVSNYREYGAGRADDFGGNNGSGTFKAFTLEDGSTTLAGAGGFGFVTGGEAMTVSNGINTYTTITFIGTGLDIVRVDNNAGGADTFSVSIDGASPISLSTTGNTSVRTQKIVSGLPYGSHTVKLIRTSSPVTYDIYVKQFVVYQPKKPTLPAGAVELVDYNVPGNYVANTTAGDSTIAQGVLSKSFMREMTFVQGTGATQDWLVGLGASFNAGVSLSTDRLNAYAEYTFFGTGFELRGQGDSTNGSTAIAVTLNGLSATTGNFPSLVSSVYGGFTFSAGSLSQGVTSTTGAGVSISGLPLALYKVRFNNGVSGKYLRFSSLDIIEPIHSVKSNLYADLQNTLPVGSCGISDNRKFTPVKDALPSGKAWAQAVGIASSPSTTSTALVPMPDMSVTIKSAGGPLQISYSASVFGTVTSSNISLQVYIDGLVAGPVNMVYVPTGSASGESGSATFIVPVGAGVHKVDLYWNTSSGTATAQTVFRILTAREM